MGVLSEVELLAVLARSGLADDEFLRVSAEVRALFVRVRLADEMAGEVLAASGYLPSDAIRSLTEYLSVSPSSSARGPVAA